MNEAPTPSRRSLVLPLLASAVLGGGVAAVAVTLIDDDGGGRQVTTIVRQAPLSASTSGDGEARQDASTGLTASDIYRKYAPGVVYVRAEVVQQTTSPFDPFPQESRSEATGTGFVIDKAGDILTNNHVIEGARKVTVQFADNKTVTAKVQGTDPSTDIALLKVDPAAVTLDPLPLGSSKDVSVGDPTVAIGNPFGLDRTLTTGVVSALQRRITAPDGTSIDDVIQTDAAINPGNSGGPLIDASGNVIGINSQIETGSSSNGNVGIGFAVPIDTAKRILDQLKSSGTVQHAYLGLTATTIDASLEALGLPVKKGALVQTVVSGGPAAASGVRPGDIPAKVQGEDLILGGDIITAIDGKAVTSSTQLSQTVSAHKPGEKITLKLLRRGEDGYEQKTIKVTLARRPAVAGGSSAQSPDDPLPTP